MHVDPAASREPDRQLKRRDLLGGAVAALVCLMAQAEPRSLAERSSADPRFSLADRLCDLVIPPTDTPGGSKAGAAAFVLLAIDHSMNALDGASWNAVRDALQVAAGTDFLRLERARQSELLEALDARAFGPVPPISTPSTAMPSTATPSTLTASNRVAELAWQRLKPAIIAGYYTSQIGASQELVYEPVPGPQRRNFTLTPDYRARSNEGFGGAL